MPQHTFKERLIAGLKAMGYRQVENERSHYTAFYNPTSKLTTRYFVGDAGALRMGSKASHSWSIGCPADKTGSYLKLLAVGDKALNPELHLD